MTENAAVRFGMAMKALAAFAVMGSALGCGSAKMQKQGVPPSARNQSVPTSFQPTGSPGLYPPRSQPPGTPPVTERGARYMPSDENYQHKPAPPLPEEDDRELGAPQVYTDVQSPNGPPLTEDGPPPPPPGPRGRPAVVRRPVGPPPSGGACGRIGQVNGIPFRAGAEIRVIPGDVVTFDYVGGPSGAPTPIWGSSLPGAERCTVGAECLGPSNFRALDDGMSYYVPYDMPPTISLWAEAGAGCRDDFVLRNAQGGAMQPPASVILDPAEYPDQSLDPNVALAGMGRWVVVGQQRYFAPYTYVLDGQQPWAPYRNGYWTWEKAGGVTWVSHDAWGWMTDHYGVWRRHRKHGWIWLPFPDRHYEPHCVSWFGNGGNIGWYPYFQGYRPAYRYGQSYGFIDGYWMGMQVGVGFGAAGYAYEPGFSIVAAANFTNPNLATVLIGGPGFSVSFSWVQRAFARGNVFPYPGGRDPMHARVFLDRYRFARPLPATTIRPIRSRGGAVIQAPTPVYTTDPRHHDYLRQMDQFRRPMPVGTVAHIHGGRADILPPVVRPGPPRGTPQPAAGPGFGSHERRQLNPGPSAPPPRERLKAPVLPSGPPPTSVSPAPAPESRRQAPPAPTINYRSQVRPPAAPASTVAAPQPNPVPQAPAAAPKVPRPVPGGESANRNKVTLPAPGSARNNTDQQTPAAGSQRPGSNEKGGTNGSDRRQRRS